ncbi:MATE family efflux transporter [Acidaminococcus intestini]|nr:MATE family efflux transporter [Acidaminococcus intestini]
MPRERQSFGTEDRSKKPSEGGKIAGASLILFALIGIAFSLLLTLGAALLSRAMNAPEAAFLKTVHYLSICGGGALIMIFYNLIGGLFRGMGIPAPLYCRSHCLRVKHRS